MKKIALIQSKLSAYGKLGLSGIGLCGFCCALPFISAVLGMGSIMAIGYYLDKIGIMLMALSAIVFIYTFYKKRIKVKPTGPSINMKQDCSCEAR